MSNKKYRNLGQYMTTEPVAECMVHIISTPAINWRIIDPACGDGNLLLAAARHMTLAGIKDVRQRLVGFDIDPNMVARARTRLASNLRCDPSQLQIYTQDFMSVRSEPLLVPGHIKWADYNVVLSNPPYGQQRECEFFDLCNKIMPPGSELVFLVPLSFLDRIEEIEYISLPGRPLKVTTGHAIVHHVVGRSYRKKPIREYRENPTPFEVLTGVKLYEKGAGTPLQTEELIRSRPYSSPTQKPGWLPCLRTGDIRPFEARIGRLWVKHGPHLAHPKDLARFTDPRLFVRRVPMWQSRRIAAAYLEEPALCAGDVLVVKHLENDIESLKGLCAFLNSSEAAHFMFWHRPSVRLRDSYPKFSAKDINALLTYAVPKEDVLRRMGRQNTGQTAHSPAMQRYRVYIREDFPFEEVSASCAREKSIRHGHISCLQMWWARRPLAVCRSVLLASLIPHPREENLSEDFASFVNSLLPGDASVENKLRTFIGSLSTWEAASDDSILSTARSLIGYGRKSPPLIADTFAGGGAFPMEALRLGCRAYASDLNEVASTALKLALSMLPKADKSLLNTYSEACDHILSRLEGVSSRLYQRTVDVEPTAFFWCKTYQCPKCKCQVPLLRDLFLAKRSTRTIVKLTYLQNCREPVFAVVNGPTQREMDVASEGNIGSLGATCRNCGAEVSTTWLKDQSRKSALSERLYAKRLRLADGSNVYEACNAKDEAVAQKARLRSLRGRLVKKIPDMPLDVNGIRHTWIISYGLNSTGQLFNHRQSVALLELAHEIDKIGAGDTSDGMKCVRTLLVLTLNRILMYSSKHSWWQSSGEFPANMFVRQGIPMVWNYVEIPFTSPAAGGLASARNWILRVAGHCQQLPKTAKVQCHDAARSKLRARSVDIVAIDPPYYDSVVYGYLADVFYVWMKPLLKEVFPGLFLKPVTSKEEEAIVDRPHHKAPRPKTDAHFRAKMLQAFQEVDRVLKDDGHLILMYGHKKWEAWAAILGPLLEAGFVPVRCWPVHTERKTKFRHGHIASLSSSCILVCQRRGSILRISVPWGRFQQEVDGLLADLIDDFSAINLYGSDLRTALLAPIVSCFSRYEQVLGADGSPLTLDKLLPQVQSLVARGILAKVRKTRFLKPYPKAREWLRTFAESVRREADSEDHRKNPVDSLPLTADDNLLSTAKRYSLLIEGGKTQEADLVWSQLSTGQRDALACLFHSITVLCNEPSKFQTLVEATLGRITLAQCFCSQLT